MISVIVPVYNREKTITNCIESILNQSYKDLEIIIIDDGSSDSTLKKCEQLQKTNSIIRIYSKKNEGVSSARSFGLDMAHGDYIAFVDSDDTIKPTMFADMYQLMIAHRSDCCVLIDYTIKKSNISFDNVSAEIALEKLCQFEFPTSVWAYLISSDLLKNIRFNENIHFFEDFYFVYEMLSHTTSISLLKGNYYLYSPDNDSVNKSGLNNKRISCLSIIPELLEGGYLYNQKLQKSVPFCIAHFIYCNIIYLNKSNVLEYGELLHQVSTKYLFIVLTSAIVPIRYKLLIFLCAIHPKLVICLTSVIHH